MALSPDHYKKTLLQDISYFGWIRVSVIRCRPKASMAKPSRKLALFCHWVKLYALVPSAPCVEEKRFTKVYHSTIHGNPLPRQRSSRHSFRLPSFFPGIAAADPLLGRYTASGCTNGRAREESVHSVVQGLSATPFAGRMR